MRVAGIVRLADRNLDVPVVDARRIEVVANGLPLWHVSEIATSVSPLTQQGPAVSRADAQPGSTANADGPAQGQQHVSWPSTPPWRAKRSRMPIVSQARCLSRRRNANATAPTRSNPELAELAVARRCKLSDGLTMEAGIAERPWPSCGNRGYARPSTVPPCTDAWASFMLLSRRA